MGDAVAVAEKPIHVRLIDTPIVAQANPKVKKPLVIQPSAAPEARQVLVGMSKSAAATLLESIMARDGGGENAIRTARAQAMAAHLDQYTEQLPERQELSKAYFLNNDERLGMTPLERIAMVYEHLTPPDNPEQATESESTIRKHMAFLVEKAFDQQLVNPPEYLSHGFEHSLRVVNYSDKVVEALPQTIDAMVKKYGISRGEARFMIDQVALLHDIGYTQLYGSDKAAHSIVGAQMVNSREHTRLLRALVQTQGAQTDNLIHDFRDAILFHNADKVEQIFSARIETSHGRFLATDINSIMNVISTFARNPQEFDLAQSSSMHIYVSTEEVKLTLLETFRQLEHEPPEIVVVEDVFRGRSINLLQPKIRALGLEFAQVDALESPMQAIIRIADNLDFLPERLSPVQQESAFQEICRIFGDKGDISKDLEQLEKLSQQAKLVAFKRQVIDSVLELPEYSGLPKSRRDAILRLALAQDSKQYRHIAGCLGLEAVEFQINPQTQALEVVARVNPQKYQSLQAIVATEYVLDEHDNKQQVDIPVSDYQIWRTQEAFKSLRVDGKPITVRVQQ